MIVALTGATGYIGRFLLKRLEAEGVKVRAWRRPSSDLTGTPSAVEWIEGGLAEPGSMTELVRGADCLIHAAYEHVPGRYRGGEGDDLPGFIERNVGGSLKLLTEARRLEVSRAIVFSSRAVFGDVPRPNPIGDDEAPTPATHYGAAKEALEAFTSSWGRGDGWPIAAIRPTGVYGVLEPIERTKWYDLVADVLAGKTIGSRTGTEVHGADVAEAVWKLATAPAERIAGRMFNCSDVLVSTRMIAEEVNRLAGTNAPVPEAGPVPPTIMASPGLKALGMRFGGQARFEETIAALVAAHRR